MVDVRRREATVVIDRIKRGEDPTPGPELTVADLAKRCLGNHVELRCMPSTAKNYWLALRNHIPPAIANLDQKIGAPFLSESLQLTCNGA